MSLHESPNIPNTRLGYSGFLMWRQLARPRLNQLGQSSTKPSEKSTPFSIMGGPVENHGYMVSRG